MSATPENMAMNEWIELLSGKYYGMVFLGLANAAYTSQAKKDGKTRPEDLKIAIEDTKYLPDLPAPFQKGSENPVGYFGSWVLEWGPAVDDHDANMLYIASYRLGGKDGLPMFFAVGIRGTDTSAGAEAVFSQVFEDFDAFSVYPWDTYLTTGVEVEFKTPLPHKEFLGPPVKPVPAGDTPSGLIAKGSLIGFNRLVTAVGDGPRTGSCTVLEALKTLVGSDTTPIVVTGHSLGGCQTQPMTSFLTWMFPENAVICHPFAPSTAGNPEFASMDYFKYGSFWWNTLDLVPCGYQKAREKPKEGYDLDAEWAVENLWHAYRWPSGSDKKAGKKCPELPFTPEIKCLLDKHGFTIVSIGYTRPISGLPDRGVQDCKIDGVIPTSQQIEEVLGLKDPTDGTSMLMWQHFPPAYKQQMWAKYKGDMVYFDYKSYHHGDPT